MGEKKLRLCLCPLETFQFLRFQTFQSAGLLFLFFFFSEGHGNNPCLRGRGLSKEEGGPVALNHSLTFCCVKTLSNTQRIECASLKYINSRAQWIES